MIETREYEALINGIETCIGGNKNKEALSKLNHENAKVVAVKEGAAGNDDHDHDHDDNVNVGSNKLKRVVTPTTETAMSNVSQTNITHQTKFGVQSVAFSQMSKEQVHTFA